MAKKKKIGRLTLTPRDVKMSPVNAAEIKRRREASGLTWQEAANRAGWSVQRWGDVENGRRDDPRLSTLVTVARVLRCKVDDLLTKH